MNGLRAARLFALKDLRTEFRSGGRLVAMGAFVVLAAFLFAVSLDRTLVPGRSAAAGLLWLVVLFAATTGAGRAFDAEEEDGAFRHVLASPAPRGAVFAGKTAANWVLVALVAVLAFFSVTAFLGVRSVGPLAWHGAVLLPGTIGLAAVGTFFGRVSSHSGLGDTLLPVLSFPLLAPVVFFGSTASARVFLGRPWSEIAGPARLLWAFALGALAVGAVLFRHATDE